MNHATAFRMFLLLAFSLLPSLATATMARAVPLTMIYGNDVRGELAPCG